METTNKPDEFLYRYEERQHAPMLDEWENPIRQSSRLTLYLYTFRILRHTPCGAWIDIGWGEKKFVRTVGRKRYACPTKDEAWKSFVARKQRQALIVHNQYQVAVAAQHLDPSKATEVGRYVSLQAD